MDGPLWAPFQSAVVVGPIIICDDSSQIYLDWARNIQTLVIWQLLDPHVLLLKTEFDMF